MGVFQETPTEQCGHKTFQISGSWADYGRSGSYLAPTIPTASGVVHENGVFANFASLLPTARRTCSKADFAGVGIGNSFISLLTRQCALCEYCTSTYPNHAAKSNETKSCSCGQKVMMFVCLPNWSCKRCIMSGIVAWGGRTAVINQILALLRATRSSEPEPHHAYEVKGRSASFQMPAQHQK